MAGYITLELLHWFHLDVLLMGRCAFHYVYVDNV